MSSGIRTGITAEFAFLILFLLLIFVNYTNRIKQSTNNLHYFTGGCRLPFVKTKRLKMPKIIPIALDKPLLDRIEAMSIKLGEAKSVIMRMAMRIGLDRLEKAVEANPADALNLVSALDSSKESSSSNSLLPRKGAAAAEGTLAPKKKTGT